MQLQDDAGVRSHHYQPEHLHETLGTEMKFNFFQLLKRMIIFHEAVRGAVKNVLADFSVKGVPPSPLNGKLPKIFLKKWVKKG